MNSGKKEIEKIRYFTKY